MTVCVWRGAVYIILYIQRVLDIQTHASREYIYRLYIEREKSIRTVRTERIWCCIYTSAASEERRVWGYCAYIKKIGDSADIHICYCLSLLPLNLSFNSIRIHSVTVFLFNKDQVISDPIPTMLLNLIGNKARCIYWKIIRFQYNWAPSILEGAQLWCWSN